MSLISRLLDFLAPSSGDADGAPKRLPSPDSLALLCRPQGEPEARMLQGILEDDGIRSMVKNRDAVGVDGGGWGPSWAYELWVLRKDLRRARETLGLDEESDERGAR
ncbi:MAG TPA: DUF2007 domain-containing protein [Dehalococcoidia bacterium]|jgi:hypothetical protein|nr:DUF2007 domain-containing protein [Dehalococcoidia bacterium]